MFARSSRPTIFGNKFKIGRDGNREEVIAKYRVYFYDRIANDPVFRRAVEGQRVVLVWLSFLHHTRHCLLVSDVKSDILVHSEPLPLVKRQRDHHEHLPYPFGKQTLTILIPIVFN